MEIDGRMIRQMVLFTLVVLIVPMILFPMLLGSSLMHSSLMDASVTTVLMELVFYGFCLFFFNKETTLSRLILNAVICLVGRYIIGAVLGVLIAIMYAMNIEVALAFGTTSFGPAVILHMLATPFILKPIFNAQIDTADYNTNTSQHVEPIVQSNNVENSQPSINQTEPLSQDKVRANTEFSNFQPAKTKQTTSQKVEDGFLKAVNYIGENGNVLMASVVDNEGLLLSSYQRSMFNSEDVAPLVLPIIEQNKINLNKMQLSQPEKTEMTFENQKLVIASEESYSLVVISERTMDDILNIRINQALEMIRIYTAERYSEKLIGNAENIYV